ncbi:uncharacterized protein LOC117650438 [Thrips palmi]|uniref:Uncharacterized protein LOC117650438 n=1 Tax=Thrips palmi TaxID=161013 RepID=A0A6P8ZY40_THRPL|nr:uncharacterized protein LOC117650438 [Thrips palmi]XP_034249756.1 uncharacterized protein LOC117650438 [Thrips palmi]
MMQHPKDKKRTRWDNCPDQPRAWPNQPPPQPLSWGQGPGPWCYPPPPPPHVLPTLHPHHPLPPPPPHHSHPPPLPHHSHPPPLPHHSHPPPPPHHSHPPPPHHHIHPPPPPRPHHYYSELDQFSAAYHSDRYDRQNPFQNPYQTPFWPSYGNTGHQHVHDQNGHINLRSDGLPGNIRENCRTSVNFNGEESDNWNPGVSLDPLVCPDVQSSATGTVKDAGTSHTGGKTQKNLTQKKAVDKNASPKEAHSQNKKNKKEKKVSSHISPSKTLCPSGRVKSKSGNTLQKSPLRQRCQRGSGVQQNGCDNSERLPLSVRRSPHNSNGPSSRASLPGGRGGQNVSGVSGKGAQNGVGYFVRSPIPGGRGGLNGRPPLPFGRGVRSPFGRTGGNQWNGTGGSRVYDDYDDEDNESDEIHQWLVSSKGNESLSGKDNDSVNKDPLPGSEEARNNAIKEAADRLKQALKTKKNVNLNKLLSSGEESKNDNQAQKTLKTFPKNLAQLELDASDMRAIGRANTEKTNCHAEDDSDDDIIEVQRPPSPVHQVIDLEPTNSFHNCSSSSDNNNSDDNASDDDSDDVPLGKKLGHVQNLCLDEDDPLSSKLDITSNPDLDGDDVPLSTRLAHVQHHMCINRNLQPDNKNRKEDHLPLPSSMEESERPTNSCNVNQCEVSQHESSVSQKNSSQIMVPNIGSAHNILNVESHDERSMHSPESGHVLWKAFSPRDRACSPNKGRPSLSPAPNLDQRRRRSSSSSSSLCESTTTQGVHRGLSNSPEQPSKPDNVEPLCPLSPFKRIYDSKQRKIISDLQKINQSKLKDLINNPRSGKFDFAMKQLMKEHRSVLSKLSREVAERRIPAEYLNPKSTELPPDDSTLLADFAIDWSSLPGELISTLGDLFSDFNSETTLNIGESQCNTLSEPSDSPDIELLSADRRSCQGQKDDQVEKEKDGLVLAPAISKDASSFVKIRVCQFAREELCSPSENYRLENNIEHPSPCPLPAPVNTETDLLVGEKQVQRGNSDWSWPNESRIECRTQEANSNQTNYPNPTCIAPRSSEDFDGPTSEPLIMDKETEPLQSVDTVSANRSLTSAVGAVKTMKNKIKPGKVKKKKKKKMANRHKRLQKKKFVRLEERSWFVESTCSKKSNSSCESKSKKITPSNPSSQNDNGTFPQCNGSFQISETVSSENIVEESRRGLRSSMSNESQRNLPNDNPSCSIESSNIPAVQQQSMSMLPVLMMTVPANETLSEVCNLSVPEMQKRIEEIDRMLQDLVQERCGLSQSLRAALAADPLQNTSVIHSAPQSSGQDAVALVEVNEIGVVSNHSAIGDSGETSKRKCPYDNQKTSKRVCHDDSESVQSIVNSDLNVQGSVSNENCLESPGSEELVQVQSKNSPKEHQNPPCKGLVTSQSSDVQLEVELDHFLNHPPFKIHPLNEVKGLIHCIKTCDTSIYASSENGLVYWIIDAEPQYLQGHFGEKNDRCVKTIEIIESRLYAASFSGQLSIYDIPDLVPNCYLYPKPKHSCTLGVSLSSSVFDWDRVYCGSTEGSVIPFNTKSFLVEEKLFDGGHPVLSMTTKTDCERRFLIVAYRRHPTEIRDAESGVLLRSFGGSEWTVYTVICHRNLVYCGANKNKILVFWFESGKKCTELVAGLGIINMKLYNDYLVCGCHDGEIYVFNLRLHVLISSLRGPGGIIYCINFNRQKMLCSTVIKSMSCITATHQNTLVMHSAAQSSRQGCAALIKANDIGVVPNHSTIDDFGETSKRKCSSNDNNKTMKRVCHDVSESGQNSASSSLNVQDSGSIVDCLENHASVQPAQVKAKSSSEEGQNPLSKSLVTSQSSDVQFEVELDHFLNHPPFKIHPLNEVKGLINCIKTCDTSIYASSENGLVYWIIDAEPQYLQGHFGEKNDRCVKTIEIIESRLYTASDSGQLSIYDIPDLVPNCYLNPKPKHSCTLGVTLTTTVFDWDRVYCGSREGSVIPFNTKSFLVEEKLFDSGHHILSMTTKTDCERRFLIVAHRRHPTEIRDAESGVLLRSFGGSEWTVYTVICHRNLVYCGANKNKILVFWFESGKKCTELVAGLGIINMKLYNDYLVCGCHDGEIYVFNLRLHVLISSLRGPGGIIYCINFNRQKMLCSTVNKSMSCITATYPLEKPNTLRKEQDEVLAVSDQKKDKASEISKKEGGQVGVVLKDLNLGSYACRNDLAGNILAIKIAGDSDVFAASSNGLVYWFRGRTWKEQVHSTFGKIKPNGSLGAVTCLEVVKSSLYTGTEDGILSIYSIPLKPEGTKIVEPILTYNISNGIQCMESCWNFLYIGTKVGSVIPFNLDAKEVGEPLSSGDYPILCIKTHKEGPRRVLIVASRQQTIAIRDALSGLLLRSFGISSPELTVYSILCHNNLVYCGSNTNNILVYDFQSGELKFKLHAGQGITAMKVYNDHLFCGCYDGKIYVFNLKTHNQVCSVNGPGNMILALDFMGKSMLCSSKSCLLTKYKHPLYTYFRDCINMIK